MARIFRINGTGALPVLLIALFVILLVLLIPLLILGVAGAAFARLGFSWPEAIAVIILMIVGYFINIPVWTFRNSGPDAGSGDAAVFDAFTGEPVGDGQEPAVLSINIGGAVIPVAVSGYLLYVADTVSAGTLFVPIGICFAVIALIVAATTRFSPGWGAGAPLFVPAIAAVACGLLLNGGTGLEAAVTAFVGGILGILFGTGAVLLMKGKQAGIRQISIGGSGMFGPIFLCALVSALIA